MISGIATSITAFIGRTPRGPVLQPVMVTGWAAYDEQFGGYSTLGPMGHSVADFFTNGGSQAVILRLFEAGSASTTARLRRDTIELAATSPGSWGDQLRVRVEVDLPTGIEESVRGDRSVQRASLFTLLVRDGGTGQVEVHHDVTVVDPDHPRHLGMVLTTQSRLVRLVDPRPRAAAANPAAHALPEDLTDPAAVWDDDRTSTGVTAFGDDGEALSAASFLAVARPDHQQGHVGGLEALDRADLVNLLVIPPFTETEDVLPEVTSAAHAWCLRRKAVLLVDPPTAWDSAAGATGEDWEELVGTIGQNAALYFPRLVQPDPMHPDRSRTGSVVGAAAGVIARTDAARGVWKAPAGLDAVLLGVSGTASALDHHEIARLNSAGINTIRTVPPRGTMLWGARTTAGADLLASRWKYLPVRRLVLFLEESLERGTRWASLEPNGEILWARLRSSVETFMHNLFLQGAFQGTRPRDAYLVRCDAETTGPPDVERGIVRILVGCAPLRPAEFMVLTVSQQTLTPDD